MWSWWKICSLKALSAVLLNSGNWALVSGTAAACQEALGVWGCCASAWACSRFFLWLQQSNSLGVCWTQCPGEVQTGNLPCWGLAPSIQLTEVGGLAVIWLFFCVCRTRLCAQTRVACCVCLVDWRNAEEVGVTPEMGVVTGAGQQVPPGWAEGSVLPCLGAGREGERKGCFSSKILLRIQSCPLSFCLSLLLIPCKMKIADFCCFHWANGFFFFSDKGFGIRSWLVKCIWSHTMSGLAPLTQLGSSAPLWHSLPSWLYRLLIASWLLSSYFPIEQPHSQSSLTITNLA